MNFSKASIPFEVIQLIDQLHANQFEGWLVGGAIRTLMLEKTPKDWDVTTNATPDQVQKIFSRTIETGISYGTVTVVINDLHIQVTTFRTEGEYENHRKPKEVSYTKNIEEDLARRDFTMNAIAFNPHTDELRDPFEGQKDLEAQWIKAVGDPHIRFQEDALRILRAIRFQSQLGFFIEEETLGAMKNASSHLSSLSRERIQQEISKWLLGNNFSMTRQTAKTIGFENVFAIKPSDQFYDCWDFISAIEPTLLFRLSAFFEVYTGQTTTQVKTDNSLKLLKSLKYPQQVISKVVQFIEFLSNQLDPTILEERLTFVKKALEIGFSDAILLLNWKLEQSKDKQLLLKQKNHLILLQEKSFEKLVTPLAIDGDRIMKILNIQPGPAVKKAMDELQNWVLENPTQNSPNVLEDRLRKK